uniref:Tubulin polymerization promoting protein family member 2 n=1 Tax=Falco tinnunculus TaxID=100819 RepID=A0A8C4V831_FALTI
MSSKAQGVASSTHSLQDSGKLARTITITTSSHRLAGSTPPKKGGKVLGDPQQGHLEPPATPFTYGSNMTGKNFKLCKGCRAMDGKAMTSTDIDIIFNKAETKGAYAITFAEFQQAIRELCSKHFKGKPPEEALQVVYGLIKGKDPSRVGATVSMSFLTNPRLTDTSNYTDSHKECFDESGKKNGLVGHQDLTDNGGYAVGAYTGAVTFEVMVSGGRQPTSGA